MIENTVGGIADEMTIEEIINHEDFLSLTVFKALGRGGIDYWEVTFKAKPIEGRPTFMTKFNQEIPFPNYKFYKTKS